MPVNKSSNHQSIVNNFDQGLKKFAPDTAKLIKDWKNANRENRKLLTSYINKTYLKSGKYSYASTRATDRAAIKIFMDLLQGKNIAIPNPKDIGYLESYPNSELGYPQAVFHSIRALERELQSYIPNYQSLLGDIKPANMPEAQDLLIEKSSKNIYSFNTEIAKFELLQQNSLLKATDQILSKLNSSLNSYLVNVSKAEAHEKIASPRLGAEIKISESEQKVIKELIKLAENIEKEHQKSFVFKFFDSLIGIKKGIPYISQSTGHLKNTENINKIIVYQNINLLMPDKQSLNSDFYTLPEAIQRLNDLHSNIHTVKAQAAYSFKGDSASLLSKALTEIKQYLVDFRGCESIKHKSQ
ncbi:MAG: hypothetical protein HRT47_10160 [Candidatus Caenarcaniphilales bacterium]|nr:hypothetical protein [Candidatus Caenarcaniphilales bacterium]